MSKYTKVYTRILVILFIMLVFIIALPNDSGNADFALEYLPSTISIKLISQTDIEASDITYDQISKTVYTSVHSLAEKYASSVVPINVTTMQVGTPIFVDGEPYKLEVSADGTLLYVNLLTDGIVKRINLASQSVDLQFSLGSDFCGIFSVDDFVIFDDQPESVAISRQRLSCSPRHTGVAIYDNGVMRPNTTQSHTGSNEIEPSDTPTILYGFNNESTERGFRHLLVDDQGIQEQSVTLYLIDGFSTEIKYHESYIYASNGTVVDPLTNTVVGEFEMVDTQSVFSIDPLTNRIFFASENSSNSAELKIYDLSTFQLLARAPIPVQLSSEAPREIIYLDANKFALTTRENNLYFFEIVPLENSVYLPQISNDYCGGPYTDDFSDTLSGWPRITTTSYLADYWNSEYRVNQNLANKWTAVTKGDIWNNSELVQIDGRLASGDGVWGLLFGLNSDWSNFYTFEILPNTQSWAIFHYSNGWYPVANGTSSAILPGTAINTLSIKHPTNGIQLQVNGTTVYSTTEKAGRVGLTGGSFVKSTDIRYDNYIFADKNCATSELFSFDSGILDQLPLHIESPNYSSLLSGD